ILFFGLGSFFGYFCRKLLNCFCFLPPGVARWVNLLSIKRADPTALSPDPAENLSLFSHLPDRGAEWNLPRLRRCCPPPIISIFLPNIAFGCGWNETRSLTNAICLCYNMKYSDSI